jgi:exopolysaccharide production protein ExoZ
MLASLMIAFLHAIELQVQPGQASPQNNNILETLSIGVDIFFVLSGFIITWSAWQYNGWRQALHFLKKRFIRLNPVYYIALLIFLLISFHHLLKTNQLPDTSAILKSIFLLPVADRTNWSGDIMPVAWTLCFEWFFYLLFALAILIRTRHKDLLLIGLGLALVAFGYITHNPDIRIRFITNPMILEFLTGVLIWRIYTRYHPSAILAFCLLAVGLAACLYHLCYTPIGMASPSDNVKGIHSLGRFLTRGIPSALLIIGALSIERKGLWRSLWDNRLSRLLGNASYSIYLIHYSVYGIGQAIFVRLGPVISRDLTILLWLLIALACGLIFYKYVEAPLLRSLKKTIPENNTGQTSSTSLFI